MRDPRPPRLSPTGFARRMEGSPYALVRVELRPPIPFHRGLIPYFDAEYPRSFTYGTLAKVDVRDARFWAESFRTHRGPIRMHADGAPVGYYLFAGGRVLTFHGGVADNVASPIDIDAGEAARIRAKAFGLAPVGPSEMVAALRLITWFDRRLKAHRSGAWSDRGGWEADGASREEGPSDWGRGGKESAPPPRPSPPKADDPYLVLEVGRDATDDEVRVAYRAQMKLNHPDRVAHLSGALQAFAHARTLAIQEAYDHIVAERARRR